MKRILIIFITVSLVVLSGCSVKEKQKIIKFEGSHSEKKWAIKDLNSEMPSDWSALRFLTLEFKSSTNQRFELKLYDKAGERSLEIVPFQGVWVRASIPLIHFRKMNTEGMDQASIWKTPASGVLDRFHRSGGNY